MERDKETREKCRSTVVGVEELPGDEKEELSGRPSEVDKRGKTKKGKDKSGRDKEGKRHTVVGVEELPRDKEEELSGRPSVVETVFSVKGKEKLRSLKIFPRLLHHLVEGVFQKMVASAEGGGCWWLLVVAVGCWLLVVVVGCCWWW